MLSSIVETKTSIESSLGQDSPFLLKKIKWYGFFLIKLVVSCGLIYWIVNRANMTEMINALQQANVPLLIGAFCMNFLGYMLSVSRWQMLLKGQGILASRLFLLQSFMVAFFLNNLLPSTFGGDAVRVYDSWRLGRSKAKAIITVFVDRFLGLIALILLVWSGLMFSWELTKNLPLFPLWIAGSTVGVIGLGFVVFGNFNEIPPPFFLKGFKTWVKVVHGFQKILDAFKIFKSKKHILGIALAISIVLQMNVIVYFFLVAQSLHFQIPLANFFFFIPVVLFIMMIPVTINGIGVRETAFVYFLGMFGVSTTEALTFAWLTYGFILVQGVLGGIVYLVRR